MAIVVLTGVSRGLGRAMAMEFARAGATICGCARSSAEVAALQGELGNAHIVNSVDVSCDDAVAAWAAKCQQRFGAADYLVNNAAMINSNALLWEISADEFNSLMAVNISGTANVIRHFVPQMVQRSTGVIVNFSSGWGRTVSAKVAPYCATKWAIEGMTKALAEELPFGMAAIPLNPGTIDTQMLRSCFGAGAEGYPTAPEWAQRAVPYILQLSASDNGRSLTVPPQ